ncbi:MAG: DUF4956 domain-containing protein [Lachnospiraceae bacterium]|nr:DUF4956 domain-containing protein [Lachnospiraceae bacterium]
MWNQLFNGVFDSSNLAVGNFVLCIAVSLVIGLAMALTYRYKTRYTQSFVVTLAMLPAVICVVIMMVNGNVGAGVAVAGAFGLVRFRSLPGTAKEIGAIFMAMAAGLITGMGYLGYAALYTIIVCGITLLFNVMDFGRNKEEENKKVLRITIPEDLDYTDVFQDLLDEFTDSNELISVKTANMGSLFKLTYHVTLKDASKEKDFIDKLRCRNGNLEIAMSKQETVTAEL